MVVTAPEEPPEPVQLWIFVWLRRYASALVSFLALVGYVCIGAAVMHHFEDWSFLQAVQFTVVSLTTVGYGNLTPTTNSAKLFIIFYVLVGLNLFAVLVGTALASLSVSQRHGEHYVQFLGFRVSVHIRAVFINIFIVLALILIGTLYYAFGQGLSAVDAFYFTVETLTTVGYGDTQGINDKTTGEWWFSILFVSIGVLSFTSCLGNIASAVAEIKIRREIDRLVKRGITMEMIHHMDVDKNGEVDRLEFLSCMLVQWGRCSERDIQQIHEVFDSLDVDGGGTLNFDDVKRPFSPRASVVFDPTRSW
eukprot:m.136422 g.136422  ORF g.136422 m.136422 type:complete len:307 (+) comp52473_c0_seq4:367-1287(+)